MYLLKTDHTGEHLVWPFLSQSSIWSKFKYGPLGVIRALDLVVSKIYVYKNPQYGATGSIDTSRSKEILYVSIYKSM